MEILSLCKIETLEQIDTQFVKIHYVDERNVCSKFGKNPFTGTSGQTGEIQLLFDFFISLFFFSDQCREETLDGFWHLMAQKMRNHARMCLLGVIKWKIEIWLPFTCQNPKNLAPNKQFPARMMKHENPNISESTKPIEMKIQHNVRNIIQSTRMQYDDVTANPIWWTAAILKIVFWLYLNEWDSNYCKCDYRLKSPSISEMVRDRPMVPMEP